ncbi:glutathione s-transferase [Ancistrocladus abbreviatus]
MQLYHHPLSLDSQKVRLALEENGIDYTSYHVNPLTGKTMDPLFFRMNPSGKLPVFQNGSHIIYNTIEIIQYIERIAAVSSGGEETSIGIREVTDWMQKIQEWNPKFFTLFHVPEKYRLYVSKFLRRVVIARMAESPDLASAYHLRLKDAYDTEEKLKDPDVLKQSEEHLVRLLDEVEAQLSETSYLVGEEFTMADVMLIPVLACLTLLKLENEYINNRQNVAEYWAMVQRRPSYKKVIGKHLHGWRKQKTLMKTWFFIHIRSLVRRY